MKKLILLGLFLFLGSVAFGQSNEECMECHSDPEITKSVNDTLDVSVFVDLAHLEQSMHEDLECVDCHTMIEDHPDGEGMGALKCAECHDDAQEMYETSIHGDALSKGDPLVAKCHDCHGGHNIVPYNELSPEKRLQVCGKCHSRPEIMAKFGRRDLDPIDSYKNSVHGRLFMEGQDLEVADCIICHGSHGIKPAIEPDAKLNRLNIPETCGSCHQEEKEKYYQSIHWQSFKRGRTASPVCTDCHGEHNIQNPDEPESDNDFDLGPTKVCASCHSSETLMGRYGLDARRLSSYMKSYHGLAVLKESKEAATCTSCHETHAIRSSRDTLSSVNERNLVKTCSNCHRNVTKEFASINMHPVDQQSRNPFAFIIRNIYIWLIVIVIGGMFLHNLIILIHYLREKRKKEKIEVRYQRFRPFEVYQHFLMMISFIGLAITGLALKFPEAGWVQLLVSIGMSEPIRALLHRIFAVVMVLISLVQLGYFIFNNKGRRDFLSMLPSLEDITHVWINMRYHLGLTKEKPEFGRYDYGEKAEYLALIWGVIVMGITGFILWFPEFFISYLPSWFFEVAEVIHYYEAWLATLAIIVWHWFFVIFHPDNYPINTTFMDGKITEENLKHHHPAEYKRILEESANEE